MGNLGNIVLLQNYALFLIIRAQGELGSVHLWKDLLVVIWSQIFCWFYSRTLVAIQLWLVWCWDFTQPNISWNPTTSGSDDRRRSRSRRRSCKRHFAADIQDYHLTLFSHICRVNVFVRVLFVWWYHSANIWSSAACTCPGESHPGPMRKDGSYVGRSAPEIDVLEATVTDGIGHVGSGPYLCLIIPRWFPFFTRYPCQRNGHPSMSVWKKKWRIVWPLIYRLDTVSWIAIRLLCLTTPIGQSWTHTKEVRIIAPFDVFWLTSF